METEKTAPAAEEKKVLIFHTGKGHGPMDTGHGIIAPGTTLKVPEHCSKKLCAAYRHIKLASDIVPEGVTDPKLEAENAKLKAEIKRLEALLKEKDAPAAEAPVAEKPAKGKK